MLHTLDISYCSAHNVIPFSIVAIAAMSVWPFSKLKRTKNVEDNVEMTSGHQPGTKSSGAEEALDFVEWGVRLAMLGKLNRAADKFRAALKSNPTDATAHYNLALALDLAGKHREAIPYYREAQKLQPNVSEIANNFGASAYANGNIEDSIEQFQKAAAINENSPETMYNLGSAFVASGEYEEAAKCLKIAVDSAPKDAQSRFNFAVALKLSGDYKRAREEFMQFLSLSPSTYPEHRAYAENAIIECLGPSETNNIQYDEDTVSEAYVSDSGSDTGPMFDISDDESASDEEETKENEERL